MDNHSDALYEIEFQRMYKAQGKVLRRILHLEKQQKCYMNRQSELKGRGIHSVSLKWRINLTRGRLKQMYDLRDNIEDYKEEISINNPDNSQRAKDSKIIAAAYEKAYASKFTGRKFGVLFGRQK